MLVRLGMIFSRVSALIHPVSPRPSRPSSLVKLSESSRPSPVLQRALGRAVWDGALGAQLESLSTEVQKGRPISRSGCTSGKEEGA